MDRVAVCRSLLISAQGRWAGRAGGLGRQSAAWEGGWRAAPAGAQPDAPRTRRPWRQERRQRGAFPGWPLLTSDPAGPAAEGPLGSQRPPRQATTWGRVLTAALVQQEGAEMCSSRWAVTYLDFPLFPHVCCCHHVDTPGAIMVPHATWLLTKLSLCRERALACDTLSKCEVLQSSRQPHRAKYYRHLCLMETFCRCLRISRTVKGC